MIGLEELRESVREVLDAYLAETGEAIPGEEGRGVDRVLWARMAELGWLGLGIAEAQGGLGLGFAHEATLYEELGRVLASVPAIPTLMAADLIGRSGSARARETWLPRILAGEAMAAVASPRAVGVPVADTYGKVSGIVPHTLFADVADLMVLPVFVREELILAIVPAGTPGVSVRRRGVVDLTRSVGDIVLEDVDIGAVETWVPSSAAVDSAGDRLALATAADAIGGAAAIFGRTIDYLKVREQFGRPIGSFQALKHRAANWQVLLEASKALVRHAAEAVADQAPEGSMLASAAKFQACDMFAAFCADAVQLHGGIGFTWEHPCHLFLKRAKLSQQLYGSSAEHKDRVAALEFAPRGAPETRDRAIDTVSATGSA